MIRIKDNKKILKQISILLCFMVVIGFVNSSSNSVQAVLPTEPSFTVEVDPITPNPAMIGEDITVTGRIKPQSFETTTPKKQIVLVLDVSLSMEDNNKIVRLKDAANKFITRMSTVTNMEIAIVSYSTEATINPTLPSANKTRSSKILSVSNPSTVTNYTSSGTTFLSVNNEENIRNLKGMITSLKAEGVTNIGEGLRKAQFMLGKGEAAANKSIVFMSDGLPNYYSVNEIKTTSNYTPYTNIDNTYPYSTGVYSYNMNEKAKTYATTIGAIIKNRNPNVFSIGYDLGASTSVGNRAMQDIHESMGGRTGTDGTFFPTDAGAIDGVFNTIADKIIAQYTLMDVKINLQPNSNFAFNGGGYVVNVSNVTYTGITNNANGTTSYTAADIPFTFTIKGNVQGNYDDVFNGATLTVPWNGHLLSTDMPKVGITIKDNVLPVINANIVSQTPDPATQSQDITLKYAVKPEIFEFNSTTFDELEPKDVIFVVDTSNKMNDKITSVKNALYGKIANNTAIKNAQYGIVTFDSTIKDNYISTGLTNNVATLDSAIKTITSSNNTSRNIGNAIIAAKTIFSNSGRSNSSKYIVLIASDTVQYTDDQLNDIKTSNFKVITVNLGYISPITKVNNQVIAGEDEPNNNIKALHYNLIGKVDNGDNILQKKDNNYFININYSKVTNTNNPNEFFTKEENMNQENTSNEINNWIFPLVSEKIRIGTVQMVPSYTFRTKLKFNLQGKFDSISGFNPCSDAGYDVETPEFNVTYNLQDGKYVSEPIEDRVFTIKIKAGINTTKLAFGPGIVSYTNLANALTKVNINTYSLNFRLPLTISEHGVYEGMKVNALSVNKVPSIQVSNQAFNFAKGANVTLAATMVGSINNESGVRLEVQNGITINSDGITVFTYDADGILTQIGTMGNPSSMDGKTTYKYISNGVEATSENILIVYSEKLPQTSTEGGYKNSLITPNGNKDAIVNVAGELPDLF